MLATQTIAQHQPDQVGQLDICLPPNENNPISPLIREFTNTEDYLHQLDIFRTLDRANSLSQTTICLLNQVNELSRKQVLYFLEDMKIAQDISEGEHINVLSTVIKADFEFEDSVTNLALEQLSSYIFLKNIGKWHIESLLVDKDIPPGFQVLFLQEHLRKNICSSSVVKSILKVVSDQNIDLRVRDEVLELSFISCKENEEFKHIVSLLSLEPDLEWFLKEKVLLYHHQNNVVCSQKVLDHLLEYFSQPTTWHIRTAIVSVLSESPKGCDQQVISFFSEFVHQDSDGMQMELLDFRQSKIQSILWSLVRLAVRHNNPSVVTELHGMAMKYDMNVYFRIRAVETLQALSFYFDTAAEALYEIVRDNKRIQRSDFVTYHQMIRDRNDKMVRDRAFLSLEELLSQDKSKFFSFLFVQTEALDSDQLYPRKVFSDQTLPESLDIYARPVLIKLVQDSRVDTEYRDRAREVLANQ